MTEFAMKRAVFFDRDGTLIDEVGYLRTAGQVRLKPGAADAVRRVKEAGLLAVVVTNQSGVARGLITTGDVERANERLQELLARQGARIDAFYYCPHLPTGTVPAYAKECECRKPKPGLLHRAAQDLDIDLTESFMVGDAARDLEAGRSARCHTIFVGDLSSMDAGTRGRLEALADATATGLIQAADYVLRHAAAEAGPDAPATRPVVSAPAYGEEARGEAPQAGPAPAAGSAPTTKADTRKRTCSRCGRAITDEEMRSGSAIESGGRHLCPSCVRELRLKRRLQPEGEDDDSQAILEELRAITRALTFETFSVMNVIGAMILVGAIGCLFKAYNLGGEPGTARVLLWAIALQLLSLTCFTLGRR